MLIQRDNKNKLFTGLDSIDRAQEIEDECEIIMKSYSYNLKNGPDIIDLTNLRSYAIDDSDTCEIDDAISLESLDIGFYLIDLAVPMAISKNKKLLIEKIKDLKVKKNLNPRELFFIFAEASDHLVLLFITNGLKKELLGRLEAVGYAPKYDQVIITKLLSDLEDSIRKKDMPKSIKLLKGAFNFTREELKKNLDQMIIKNRT